MRLPQRIASARLLVALLVIGLNAALLLHFHDRFWWPPDEGNYAHVAERLLDGEVLHADVQDIHPGYVNFANAAAMALFGRELSSMRYPLALLGVVQSLLLFLVLSRTGILTAAIGATGITALGFLQFLNPSAHWYCLFLVVLLVWVLHATPRAARWRLDVVGAIVMSIVLFRQLSGILVAMGALTWLLLEAGSAGSSTSPGTDDVDPDAASATAHRPWAARTLLVIMLVGLTGYLLRATDVVGWLLFGIWPVVVLLHAIVVTTVANARVFAIVSRLARGAAVAAMPLLAYHAAHGSLGPWYRDVVAAAVGFPGLPFFRSRSYADLIPDAVQALATGDVLASAGVGFWIALAALAATLGVRVLGRLLACRNAAPHVPLPPIACIAVFYAVVSVHYQIPIYLAYTAGVSLAALAAVRRPSGRFAVGGAVLLIAGLYLHAGQPLSRPVGGAPGGERITLVASGTVPRIGLAIEPADVALYGALIALIHREVPPNGSILAIPSNAELYFLSGRRNPFRFFNTALGVTTAGQLQTVLETLEREPPILVFHDPRDKYNTPASRAIMERVRAGYEQLPGLGQMQIYRHPALHAGVAAGPGTPSYAR